MYIICEFIDDIQQAELILTQDALIISEKKRVRAVHFNSN